MSLTSLLSNATVSANSISMTQQLSAKQWGEFRALMLRAGGQWKKSEQAFLFERDPSMLVERLLDAGSRGFNKFHLYETPEVVTDFIIDFSLNEFSPDYETMTIRVLEPSIGGGSLIMPIMDHLAERYPDFTLELVGYDIDPINVALCQSRGINVTEQNFLKVEADASFDLVIMNPPFNGKEYIKHIKHAQAFLKPRNGSLLLSVAPTHHVKKELYTTSMRKCNEARWLHSEAMKVSADHICEPFEDSIFKGATVETSVFSLRHADYENTLEEVSNLLRGEAIRLDCINPVEWPCTPNPENKNLYAIELNRLLKFISSTEPDTASHLGFYDPNCTFAQNYFLDKLGKKEHLYECSGVLDELKPSTPMEVPEFLPSYATRVEGDQVALAF